jgi:hypothetical protein
MPDGEHRLRDVARFFAMALPSSNVRLKLMFAPRRRYRLFCCLCIHVILSAFLSQSCLAQAEGLEDVAVELADQIADALKESPETLKGGVNVTTIDGRETGGPGFRNEFLRALKEKGVVLSRTAPCTISGSVQFGGEQEASTGGAVVKLSLKGPNLDRELTGEVREESDVISLIGMTGALPVKLDKPRIGLAAPVPGAGRVVATNDAERKARLAKLIQKPEPPRITPNATPALDPSGKPETSEVHVQGYGLEILIKDANGKIELPDGTRYSPRPPVKAENGELFVDIHPGEVYAVKLINESKEYDAGVKLTIDGLNSFEFSEEESYKKLGMWIIPHQSSGIIRGWHTRNKDGEMVLAEFEVAKYGEGLAEEMGAFGDVGRITASFRAAWSPEEKSPGTILAYNSVRGTKKGEEVMERLSELDRHFGEIRAAISIRYQLTESK